ncbi:uncharacterized protein N7473_004667 [Penicillium subrubescens]|jgi:hypothetical protein|uniref:Uncharacterized protein n=1 Tax=Penicillium subrubescens TaxID=1316194 RepID=A0A1Q5UR94_9EURO|nr:uncharacterized protein N7473_004667 [Penicillium subrubescens]KAJ5900597.1 hypothetical protein N7473_004667 [Penicillium subrubescens]OKP14992.1 hypothetical protein PENSUB_3387 [Penicillium subrubescens]
MRITLYLTASMAGLSLAAPAAVKPQTDLDPLGLGPAVEDVTNQVTGLVGSIIKRDLPLNGIPLINIPRPAHEKRDEQN